MLKEKTTKEEVISMYDPFIDACREIPVSRAKKLVEEAKRLEKILKADK